MAMLHLSTPGRILFLVYMTEVVYKRASGNRQNKKKKAKLFELFSHEGGQRRNRKRKKGKRTNCFSEAGMVANTLNPSSQRQVGNYEFEVILVYIASSREVRII